MPLSFEVNRGQADPRAKFMARGRDVGLFFTDGGAVIALSKPAHHDDPRLPGAQLRHQAAFLQTRQSLALRYRFAGANRHPQIEALDPLPGHGNYLIGNDPERWHTDVAQYRRVRYRDLYPGVNVVYYGKDGRLEFDIEAAPGADVSQVRLRVDGADSVALDDAGNLQLHTTLGVLTQSKPVVYQMIGGERRELRGDYLLRDIRRDKSAHEVAFQVADYDRRYAVVLDPTLVFAKLIGGTGYDDANGVAVDSSGNSYATGSTNSPVFPTTVGAYQTTHSGYDAFVTKISADGTTLIYSTLIGGNGADIAYGIGIDTAGNAYITGSTSSSNFPLLNALQSTPKSGFVTALNAAGNGLNYSTYLDASGGYAAIAVDASGDAYVTGQTYSTNFPVSPGAFQTTNATGGDAFVAKLNPAGGRVYATYLGGTGYEEGRAIAVDSEGDAYIAGDTTSASLNGVTPAKLGPLGGGDMLIAELNPFGTGLVYATEIGGTGLDEAIGIAVDGGHQVYFAAFSNSGDLPPTTPPQHTGVNEAYIGHLDDSGTVLYDLTWYGATDGTQSYGYAINLDEARQSLYVAGQIQSYPAANSLGNTPSINAVTGLDCASSCAAITGAFLLQYSINPLTLASATRVTGGSATNAIFNAVAHDAVSGHVAAVGSSDGNPPTTVAINPFTEGSSGKAAVTTNAGGDDLFEALIAYANSLPPQPPIIDKRFDPSTIIKGKQVDLTFVITNPNQVADITNLVFSDLLPTCLSGVNSKPIFNPPSCYFITSAQSRGYYVQQPPNTQYPPGMVCSITFKVQAVGPEPCDNVTNAPTSRQGTGKPAAAHLHIISAPLKVWNGAVSSSLSIGGNFVGGVALANGDDVTFGPGAAQTTVTNDLSLGQAINEANLSGTGYNLGGSTFNFLAGINNSGASNTFSAQIKAGLPLVFSSNPAGATLNLPGGINLNGNNIDFNGNGTFNVGQIVGAGDVNGDGFADIIVNASPTFVGNLNIAGGTLFADASVSETIKVFDTGTARGLGPLGDVIASDSATIYPGTDSTPVALSLASLTVNGGLVESALSANNTSHSSLNVSGAVQLNGGNLKLDLAAQPTVGTTFTNLITAPGTGTNTITGCFGETAATPSNVLLIAQCTSSSVSAIVKAVDDLFHSGFGG